MQMHLQKIKAVLEQRFSPLFPIFVNFIVAFRLRQFTKKALKKANFFGKSKNLLKYLGETDNEGAWKLLKIRSW